MEEDKQAFNAEVETDATETQECLSSTLDELAALKRKDEMTSAELIKLRAAKESLESELDYLRKKVSDLIATNKDLSITNKSLTDNLREAQKSLGETKLELTTLRNKIYQVQKFLAG